MEYIDGRPTREEARLFEGACNQAEFELEVSGGTAKVVELNPDSDGPTVVFPPGWASGLEAQRELLRFSFENGVHAVSLEYPRRGGQDLDDEHIYHRAIEQPVDTLFSIFDELGLNRVSLVPHSTGFIHSIIAAQRDTDRIIESITADAPAGIIKPNTSLFNAMRLGLLGLGHVFGQPNRFGIMREAGRHLGVHGLRASAEYEAIVETDISDEMIDVANRIPVTIMLQRGDELFDVEEIYQKLVEIGFEDTSFGQVKFFIQPGAGHSEMLRSQFFMQEILGLALDKYRSLADIRRLVS